MIGAFGLEGARFYKYARGCLALTNKQEIDFAEKEFYPCRLVVALAGVVFDYGITGRLSISAKGGPGVYFIETLVRELSDAGFVSNR